ncbi:MAG: hypothetical protein HY709_00570 [Candidatus Latescibacteria bacterium]|nr:hypothetical protein [Candidatus Latescibacterota bacterium]
MRLEADVVVQDAVAGIQIGSDPRSSSFRLQLDPFRHEVVLTWAFRPPPESDFSPHDVSFTEPFPVLNGVVYRLGLDVTAGRVRVTVRSPVCWRLVRDTGFTWSSLAITEEGVLLLTDGVQPYLLSQDGETRPLALDTPVSEMRVWERKITQARAGRPLMGVCLPHKSQVLVDVSFVSRQVTEWPFSGGGGIILGTGVGSGAGEFLYPLSCDAGPDGRIYVLDAGNDRIQSFTPDGQYITQWGSGVGQFDFGGGGPERLMGSIVVDSSGVIYILDMGNRRIQVFER